MNGAATPNPFIERMPQQPAPPLLHVIIVLAMIVDHLARTERYG